MPRFEEEIKKFCQDNQINEFFSESERNAIEKALKEEKLWNVKNNNIESVRNKIKAFHLKLTQNRCCYCYKSLLDRKIESDREHIIPRSIAKELSFDLFNISIACKRCNMEYKKERIDHIINIGDAVTLLENPDNYRIPHPNIDIYEEHIRRICIDLGRDKEIAFYKTITDKGKFLFNFVRLDLL